MQNATNFWPDAQGCKKKTMILHRNHSQHRFCPTPVRSGFERCNPQTKIWFGDEIAIASTDSVQLQWAADLSDATRKPKSGMGMRFLQILGWAYHRVRLCMNGLLRFWQRPIRFLPADTLLHLLRGHPTTPAKQQSLVYYAQNLLSLSVPNVLVFHSPNFRSFFQ